MEVPSLQKRDVVRKVKSNVIRLEMDAMFFFERAVQCLDRFHYDKALKNFRKAVELEPDNPVNYCNMAGTLSEIGQYEESNKILRKILDDIEPSMTECYFYMANNYANMGSFILAEEALLSYLELDPIGHYMEETEEMMELLSFELKRPLSIPLAPSNQKQREHERARILMEDGHFAEAVVILEQMIEEHPNFIPAQNNLALAYYYTGEIEKGFAIIEDVLAIESDNLQALCNLALFLKFSGDDRQSKTLVQRLAKTVPFNQENLFKLAMTLGILGEHESAYPHFVRILRMSQEAWEPSLFHYAAVAATYTGRYEQAENYWNKAKQVDPDSNIPEFYLAQLEKVRLGEDVFLSYHYHLPFREQLRLFSVQFPVWENKWHSVIELAFRTMKGRFDLIELYDMQTLWIDFLTRIYPDIPLIRKVEGWSGALEYLTAKMHGRAITYREISDQYGISMSTIRNHVKRIDEVCGLSEKMNTVFPQIQQSLRNLNR